MEHAKYKGYNIPISQHDKSLGYICELLDRNTSERLNHLFRDLAVLNLGFHFTPVSFRIDSYPIDAISGLMSSAHYKGWKISNLESEDSFLVETGYVDNILQNGFNRRTCIAGFENQNQEFISQHPRLLLEGFRNMVINFSKHAVPYKDPSIGKDNVVISDLSSAIILLSDRPKRTPKGQIRKTRFNPFNCFDANTFILEEGSDPEDIVGVVDFKINDPISFRNRKPFYRNSDLLAALSVGIVSNLERVSEDLGKVLPQESGDTFSSISRIFPVFYSNKEGLRSSEGV